MTSTEKRQRTDAMKTMTTALDLRAIRLDILETRTDVDTNRLAQRAMHRFAGLQHGIASYSGDGEWTGIPGLSFRYVNMGDSYAATLVCIESLPDGVRDGELRVGWQVSSFGTVIDQAEIAFTEASGLNRCFGCGSWSKYVDYDHDVCTECVDGLRAPDEVDTDDILTALGRAFLVDAIATACEESKADEADEVSPGVGGDWFNTPAVRQYSYGCTDPDKWSTPQPTVDACVRAFVRACGGLLSIRSLAFEWSIRAAMQGEADRAESEHDSIDDAFGHLFAMQSLGHGIGLLDHVSDTHRSLQERIEAIKPFHWEMMLDLDPDDGEQLLAVANADRPAPLEWSGRPARTNEYDEFERDPDRDSLRRFNATDSDGLVWASTNLASDMVRTGQWAADVAGRRMKVYPCRSLSLIAPATVYPSSREG